MRTANNIENEVITRGKPVEQSRVGILQNITNIQKNTGKMIEKKGDIITESKKIDMSIVEETKPVEVSMADATNDWEDIDESDVDDPQACTIYVNDIYANIMKKELADRVSPDYMSNQADITEKMRAIMVDWLVEVHRMFKLLPETLYLAANIIDRFLEKKPVSRDKLQLVGVTSMLIASKYEEIYAPECNDFVYISDGAYSKEQILKMEQLILNTLNFNLTAPSPLHFLRRYSKAANSDYTMHTLCKYLIELALLDVKLLKYVPSEIAAASVYIARKMTSKTPVWTSTLTHYSTYDEASVKSVAIDLNELLHKSQKSSLGAIRKKYSANKFGCVAQIPLCDI
eukprot:TRINITY_DN3696_c0_g1_i2.p1 TRINITY_DN3696_c0_g1~~TRINITY_DN3696_c0_g1_i2.p1  ORF type:complete len:343 (-),score=92.45 TRINITY_DN3696_c0_g1_i2:193-1221(-)